MKSVVTSYFATLIAFVVIDFVWLSLTAERLYRPVLREILLDGFRFHQQSEVARRQRPAKFLCHGARRVVVADKLALSPPPVGNKDPPRAALLLLTNTYAHGSHLPLSGAAFVVECFLAMLTPPSCGFG